MGQRIDGVRGAESVSAGVRPPGPKPMPLLGNIPDMRRAEGMLGFHVDMWRTYGDIYQLEMGPVSLVGLVRPEHIRHIALTNRDNYIKGVVMENMRHLMGHGLLTADGDLWRKQRKLMQPFFTPKGIRAFAGAMVELTEEAVDGWADVAASRSVIDIGEEMTRLTLSIITRTMFGTDAGQSSEVTNQAFEEILECVNDRSALPIQPPLWLPLPSNRRFRRALDTVDEVIQSIIQRRAGMEATSESEDILLGRLLGARDDETGEAMSLKQVKDEVVTLYFAGHETTARTLTWAFYFLSRHPEVQTHLLEELDAVVGPRPPTLEDAFRLPYARMVVDEVLRLAGPVWGFGREAVEEDVIDGFRIPKGAMVLPVTYITHRLPDLWDNPEGFDPSRFSPEAVKARDKFAYNPFGVGERVCIGNHFSLLETVLILASVCRRYRLELEPGCQIEASGNLLLKPNRPVRVTPRPRTPQAPRGA